MQGLSLKVIEPNVRILVSGLTLHLQLRLRKILRNLDQNQKRSITSFNELARGGIDADQKYKW